MTQSKKPPAIGAVTALLLLGTGLSGCAVGRDYSIASSPPGLPGDRQDGEDERFERLVFVRDDQSHLQLVQGIPTAELPITGGLGDAAIAGDAGLGFSGLANSASNPVALSIGAAAPGLSGAVNGVGAGVVARVFTSGGVLNPALLANPASGAVFGASLSARADTAGASGGVTLGPGAATSVPVTAPASAAIGGSVGAISNLSLNGPAGLAAGLSSALGPLGTTLGSTTGRIGGAAPAVLPLR